MVEGTTAGLAARIFTREYPGDNPDEKLNIWLNGKHRLALIDAVVSADLFVASHAIWDMSRVKAVIATRVSPQY